MSDQHDKMMQVRRRHQLVDDTLYCEEGGIIGRCTCGWDTGHRFSSMAASAAFADHQDSMAGIPVD